MASPARSAVNVCNAGEVDDVVGAVLSVDDDRDLEDAAGAGLVDKVTAKCRLHQLRDSNRANKRKVPAIILEVFTLT